MKNKNLFFSLALLSALGGIGGTVVFATGARPMSFVPQTAAMSDSISQGGLPQDTTAVDIPGTGNDTIPQGGGELPQDTTVVDVPGTGNDTIPQGGGELPQDTTVVDIPGTGNDTIPQGGGQDPADPSDYTSVMYDPSFEADTTQYWGHTAYGVGTLNMGAWRLDYNVNEGSYINFSTRNAVDNPSDGSYYADVWAGRLKALDLYQVVWGLPAGIYQVSARLRNIDEDVNYLSDQHVYAEINGSVFDSPVMSEASLGSAVENWEELTTVEFIVPIDTTFVRIGVRSTGNGNDPTGWFQVDDFRIVRTGDITVEKLLEQVNEKYTTVVQWLDSVATVTDEAYAAVYMNALDKVEELYGVATGHEDLTWDDCDSVMWEMTRAWNDARDGERLINRILSCEEALLKEPDDDLAAALDVAKSVAQAGSGNYAFALSDLERAYTQYLWSQQIPAEWNFSGYGVAGDFAYTLDDVYQVACVASYLGENQDVEVPERFMADNGLEYTVVGFGAEWSTPFNYSVRSVKLPATLRFIGAAAFQYCEALESVEIPEAVDSIGASAFSFCTRLRQVTLPYGVKTLGDEVFSFCSSLEEIEIPESVVSIGNYAFQGTRLTELHLPSSLVSVGAEIFSPISGEKGLEKLSIDAVTPPVVNGSLGSLGTYVIHVPQGSGAAYRSADVWNDYIIMEGEGVNLTIDVDTPGTLGEKVLEQTTDLADVNYLTLTGSLNEDDIYNIQNRLTSLLEIDMAGTDMTEMPDGMFNGREALRKIVLPDSLQTIGNDAFRDCASLDSISLPGTLKSIGSSAFSRCYKLRDMFVPNGVTTIGSYAFEYCHGLEYLRLPATLEIVESRMAVDCINLKELVLSEGISYIGEDAFRNASNLQSVYLPSTLTYLERASFGNCTSLNQVTLRENMVYCADAFCDCVNLKTVTCLSLLPPDLLGDLSPFGWGADMSGRTLYVPSIALTDYKLTIGWDAFPNIQGINYLPQDIQVYKPYELEWNQPDSVEMYYKPDLTLAVRDNYSTDGYGSLKVSGTSTLSLGRFAMTYDPNIYYGYFTSPDYPSYNALVADAPMRADSVRVTVYNKSDRWLFLSFPYDVRVSDIMPVHENTSWVIRKYSGADRAAGNMENTWQNMTADSVLQAGVGYIWQSTRQESDWCGFMVPAVDNANKNQIFANSARSVALEEHLAEFSHNRSWNLVGNPFPCFYDIRFMGFTAPVTVWNERNNTYEAYSPVDDGYILRPGEAFFVQRPVDQEAIEFSTEGRQVDRTVRELPVAAGVNVNGATPAVRQVFNLTLTDGQRSDRTRFVLNENAKAGYDMATDAGKFMSPDAAAPQLYTTEDGVDFSINELPVGDGLIALAARFGSDGTYTISLDTEAGAAVYLVDKQTGAETDLRRGGYTFQAEAGTVADRFVVKVTDNGGSEGSTTGVDGAEAQGVTVSVAHGQIQVVAPEASSIAVYAVDGKAIGTAVAAEASFEVRPGVYVVIVDGASHKVTVIE